MDNKSFSEIENEMINFDFKALENQKTHAVSMISAKDVSAGDIKNQICDIWKKIGKFIKLLKNVPIIGKYVTILCDLLDSICSAQ